MLFTREPMIETVITARGGYRLALRGNRTGNEEILADAVEIVSFGSALFYRCNERSRSALLPIADYEVVEVKEGRVLLKHLAESPREAGGRESSRPDRPPAPRESQRPRPTHTRSESARTELPKGDPEPPSEGREGDDESSRGDRRRQRRRQKRRGEGRAEGDKEVSLHEPSSGSSEGEGERSPAKESARPGSAPLNSSPLAGGLIPPPSSLVSDFFLRYEKLDNPAVLALQEDSKQRAREADTREVNTRGADTRGVDTREVDKGPPASSIRSALIETLGRSSSEKPQEKG